ncbi:MAG: hypothetical protein ABIO57_02470 [Candidatus Paceibacterota bacterium]
METFTTTVWIFMFVASLFSTHAEVKKLLDKNAKVFVYQGLFYNSAKKRRWLLLVSITVAIMIIFLAYAGLTVGPHTKLSYWFCLGAIFASNVPVFLMGLIAFRAIQKSDRLTKEEAIKSYLKH